MNSQTIFFRQIFNDLILSNQNHLPKFQIIMLYIAPILMQVHWKENSSGKYNTCLSDCLCGLGQFAMFWISHFCYADLWQELWLVTDWFWFITKVTDGFFNCMTVTRKPIWISCKCWGGKWKIYLQCSRLHFKVLKNVQPDRIPQLKYLGKLESIINEFTLFSFDFELKFEQFHLR